MPSYGVGVVPKMVFHRNKIHADQRTDSIVTGSAYELSHELSIKLGLKQRYLNSLQYRLYILYLDVIRVSDLLYHKKDKTAIVDIICNIQFVTYGI